MNGLESENPDGPYFHAPQQQQQPIPQSGKRKGEEESPSGGGSRVCILSTWIMLRDLRESH